VGAAVGTVCVFGLVAVAVNAWLILQAIRGIREFSARHPDEEAAIERAREYLS